MTITKAEIEAGLDAFASEPALAKLVRHYRPDTISTINALMSVPDDEISVDDIGRAVSWLKGNWADLNSTQRTKVKTRFRALRNSTTASDGVKAYIEQAVRRFKNIGDDDATVLARLEVVLTLPAAQVDPTELQHLMDRAKAVWDTLA